MEKEIIETTHSTLKIIMMGVESRTARPSVMR